MFYRREGIWQHCWPTFQKENEKYRGQIPASGSTMSTYAVNEVVKSSTGTSNFHNQYTSVKWILSYPVTSSNSQTKSLQGILDWKTHCHLSLWQTKECPNTHSQKSNPNHMPRLIIGGNLIFKWSFIFIVFFFVKKKFGCCIIKIFKLKY